MVCTCGRSFRSITKILNRAGEFRRGFELAFSAGHGYHANGALQRCRVTSTSCRSFNGWICADAQDRSKGTAWVHREPVYAW